jgi:hypothetical protein
MRSIPRALWWKAYHNHAAYATRGGRRSQHWSDIVIIPWRVENNSSSFLEIFGTLAEFDRDRRSAKCIGFGEATSYRIVLGYENNLPL